MAFDLKAALTGLAPTLATMLGGPFAGTAVSALESAFGLTKGAGVDGITNAMQSGAMTPDIAAAVRKADQEHAEKLKQMDIDLAKLNADHDAAMATVDAADKDSARKREIAAKDRTPAHLAYTIIGGFLAISIAQLIAIMGYPDVVAKIPGQGWLLIGNVSGYLAAEAKACASYYFGTSTGSRDKDDTIKALAQ